MFMTRVPAMATIAITSDSSTLTVDPTSQDGAFALRINGINQLAQQWFWYRVGSSNQELSVDTLPLVTASTESPLHPNIGHIEYTGNNLDINITYDLTHFVGGSDFLQESVRLSNTSGVPMDFHFFQYTDLNINNYANDDEIYFQGNLIQGDLFGRNSFRSVALPAPAPSHYQAGVGPIILGALSDLAPTTLSDLPTSPIGPGDANWSFQWDVTLLPSVDFVISSQLILGLPPGAGEFGDMNDDGQYSTVDIDLFKLALRNPDAYYTSLRPNGLCICLDPVKLGDANMDGQFDFDDGPGFARVMRERNVPVFGLSTLLQIEELQTPEPHAGQLVVLTVILTTLYRRRPL